jgi:hypothetical protein
MIHFDFIVTDADAENILRALRNDALKCDVRIIELMALKETPEDVRDRSIAVYKHSKEYTLSLITKMKNTRIQD